MANGMWQQMTIIGVIPATENDVAVAGSSQQYYVVAGVMCGQCDVIVV